MFRILLDCPPKERLNRCSRLVCGPRRPGARCQEVESMSTSVPGVRYQLPEPLRCTPDRSLA